MVKYAKVTTCQVRQIWKAADLRPHGLKTFKNSSDPQFSDKAIDMVRLYMNSLKSAIIHSVDEKTNPCLG